MEPIKLRLGEPHQSGFRIDDATTGEKEIGHIGKFHAPHTFYAMAFMKFYGHVDALTFEGALKLFEERINAEIQKGGTS